MALYQKIQSHIPPNLKKRLFETTRVRDIAVKWDNIVTAKTTDSLYNVYKMLIDHKILFAPLYDDDSQEYIGYIELLDILAYSIEVLKYDIHYSDDWINDFTFHNTPCIKANPIGSAIPERNIRNKWHIIQESAPLYTAINVLTDSEVSRIAVIDSYGKLNGFLTKINVVDYISQQSMDLGALGDNKIDSLPLISNKLITVEKSEKILSAFLKLYHYNISGVGVIDDKCNIIGNVSFNDLELCGYSIDMFRKLFMSTKEFLTLKDTNNKTRVSIVHKTSDLRDMLESLRNCSESQRAYIITKDNILYGMIPLTNIIALFNALHAPMPQR